MNLDIVLEEGVQAPKYATDGSVGFDLIANKILKLYKGDREIEIGNKLAHSLANNYIMLRPGERVLLGTGIRTAIPKGYELQIRSRSGMTLKTGVVVGNSPGTIDQDYRGELGAILINTTPYLTKIDLNNPIAQAVLCPVEIAEFNIVKNKLPDTVRGEGGFGHTNK